MKIRNINIQKILIFIALNFIALNFIMISDDYIFANLKFNGIFEFVFNNNGTETYAIKNGRYLGNLLGILISMTYKFDNLKYIRGIFMGSGIFILILLCSKLSMLEKEKSFIISTLLILLAPIGIYRQVYSWTSAYMNYLVSTILFLLILYIFNKCINKNKKVNRRYIYLIVLLGVSCQLFMENITIYICLFSLILLIFSNVKYKNLNKMSLAFFISTLLGAIMMFSCKGYRQINTVDSYRSMDIGNFSNLIRTIIFNAWSMTKYIVLDNFILITIILMLCFIISKKNNNKYNKIYRIFIIFTIIYIFAYAFIDNYIDLIQISRNIRLIKYLFDTMIVISIMVIIWTTIYKYIKDKNLKNKLYFYYISIIIVSMPLLIVNPIGTRCFFICYIFWVMICLDIIGYVLENKFISLKYINLISTILVIIILVNKYYIFNNINNEFNQMIIYTENQMLNKEKTILLPEFKFKEYIHSDIAPFMGFLYYYKTPKDIKFKTIDYDEWEKITLNE